MHSDHQLPKPNHIISTLESRTPYLAAQEIPGASNGFAQTGQYNAQNHKLKKSPVIRPLGNYALAFSPFTTTSTPAPSERPARIDRPRSFALHAFTASYVLTRSQAISREAETSGEGLDERGLFGGGEVVADVLVGY